MAKKVTEREEFFGALPAFDPRFAKNVLERFDSHQERLRRSRLHDRMRRAWLLYYSRDQRDAGCDMTQVQLSGERGEVLVLKPNRFRRLVQDQLDVVRQTPPDYEAVALNTDAEAEAQTSLWLAILDEYKRKAHLEERRTERAEMAALFGEGVMHIRWDPSKGRQYAVQDVKVKGGKTEARPFYEGDFVFSVRSPYEVAYDPTSPDRRRPRWWIVREPEDKWDLLAEYGDDSPEIDSAIRGAEPWSRMFHGDKMFGREEVQHDDSIAVFHVYVEASKACPDGRYAKIIDGKTVLLDGPLGEDRAGVFALRPADVIFKPEGHTSNFDGMPIAEAHGGTISTIISNADAHGLKRLMVPRGANLDDVDKGAGLVWMNYDHVDINNQPIPPPAELQLQVLDPGLVNLEELLSKELDMIMGGSAVQRGDPEATKGDSGSKAALLFAAAQSVGNAFMTGVLRGDEEIATFMLGSFKRHATVPRIVAIVGKKNGYTATEWTNEDLSQIDRVHVRHADAARDSFQGRMQIAEMLIPLPADQREQMQEFILTGKTEGITEDMDQHRVLIDREDEALRDENAEMPIVDPCDQHLEHLKSHIAQKENEEVRRNPVLKQRIDQHNMLHIAALTPGHPGFAGTTNLMITGQTPFPAPDDPNAQPPQAKSDAKEAPPQGKQPDSAPSPQSGSTPSGGASPAPAQQPKNPATGERLPLPPAPTPQVGQAR